MKKILTGIIVLSLFLTGCSNAKPKIDIPVGVTAKTEYSGNLLYRNILIKLEPYFLSNHKVKIEEWNLLMPEKKFKGTANAPVVVQNIKDIQEFCNRKSLQEGLIPAYENGKLNIYSNGYRLPKEEEIYYAYNYKGNVGISISSSEGSSNEMFLETSEIVAASAGETMAENRSIASESNEVFSVSQSDNYIEFNDKEKEEFLRKKALNQKRIKENIIRNKEFNNIYSGLYYDIEESRALKDGGLDEIMEGDNTVVYTSFRIARNLGSDNESTYSVYQNQNDRFLINEDRINGINLAYPEGWGVSKFIDAGIKERNSTKKTNPALMDYKGKVFYLPLFSGDGYLYKFGYYVYSYSLKKDETVNALAERLRKDIGSKEEFYNYFMSSNKYYFMLKREVKNEDIFFILKDNKLYEFSFSSINMKTPFPEELKKILIEKIFIQ